MFLKVWTEDEFLMSSLSTHITVCETSITRSRNIHSPVFEKSKARNDVVKSSFCSGSRTIEQEEKDRCQERLRAACQQCWAITAATVANGAKRSAVGSHSASQAAECTLGSNWASTSGAPRNLSSGSTQHNKHRVQIL